MTARIAAAVLGDAEKKTAKEFELVFGVAHCLYQPINGIDAGGDFSLKQCEEQVFLTFEVGVKGATSVAGLGSNLLQFRGLKTIASKDFFGGADEPAARRLRAVLAAEA